MDIPWGENATVVRMAGKSMAGVEEDGEMLFEGPLLTVVSLVRDMKPPNRDRLRISLPDRQARPHSFQKEAIHMLLYKFARAQA